MRRRRQVMAPWLTLGLLAAAPAAATTPGRLAPPESRVGYTVYAFGLVPLYAEFQDFTGTLTTGPGPAAACRVQVTVRVASLHTQDPDRDRLALGASMLDAAHYPTMAFAGRCIGDTLTGMLTLHGITLPLTLALQRDGRHVMATGMLQRRDYHITGMAGVLGQRIRIHLDALLPEPPPAVLPALPAIR